MSDNAEKLINIDSSNRVTIIPMSSFSKIANEVMGHVEETTGQQALPVHGELPCCIVFAELPGSRTRDYKKTAHRTASSIGSGGEPERHFSTGPTRPAGNKGELYGGFAHV